VRRGDSEAAAYEAALGFIGSGGQLATEHPEVISTEFDHPAGAALAVPLKPLQRSVSHCGRSRNTFHAAWESAWNLGRL